MEKKQQRYQREIQSFCYMDDDFMTACFEDNAEGVELVLRIVLGKQDIKVKSVSTQKTMKNLRGRSAILDIYATDSRNREYNVEIQRSDAGTGARRARHNSSLLDSYLLKPGEKTENMPEAYVIFIAENDVMKGGQAVYPVERYVSVGDRKVLFGDGSHILYVNGKYRGNDDIGRLMHDFSCTNPDDMYFEELAGRARYFKCDKEGMAEMGRISDVIREEGATERAKKTAVRLIRQGKMTLEDIAEATELPFDVVKELERGSGKTVS